MTVSETTDFSRGPISGQVAIGAPITATLKPRHLLRPAIDVGLALSLFFMASLTLGSPPSLASPGLSLGSIRIAPAQATDNPGQTRLFQPASVSTAVMGVDHPAKRFSQQTEWMLLGLAFSLLVAMNLAFFRHLRHAYADPRKRSSSKR